MEELKEIARIIADVGLKKVDSFLQSDGDSGLMSAFYNGLINGEFDDDIGAAKKLYNVLPTDERYKQLKSRFKEKLYNTVPFVDFAPPRFTMLRQKMYECNREQTAMKQCVENGAQDVGYAIAKRLLVKARKYHLTIVELECLYIILNHIQVCTGNKKEFDNVCHELRLAQRKLNAETEAGIIYGEVSNLYAVTYSDHPENAPFIADCIYKLEVLLSEFDTFKIRYDYFLLRSLLGQVKRDQKMRIEACEDAIHYFKNNPDIAGNLIGVFTLEKIESYLHIREYDLLLKLSKECAVLFNKHTSNWLKIKYYECIALLSKNQPVIALEVFREVQKVLKKNGGGAKKYNDQWLIIEGYIYLYLHTENKELLPTSFQLPPMEAYMRKFLTQELHSLSGDKEGANVGLMILHIFLLLSLKSNPTDILEKVKALDRYKRSYLNQT